MNMASVRESTSNGPSNSLQPHHQQQKQQYIYELPYLCRKQVCRILDVNNDWKDLAGTHMGFSVFDILEIENECRRTGSSPSDMLLTRWGQQNHTTLELFVLLVRMEHHPAMNCLKSNVDPRYHRLINQELATSTHSQNTISNNKMVSKEDNSSRNVPLHVRYVEQGIKIQSSSKILNGPPYESSDKHDTRSTNASIAESASALLMIPYAELATATHNWNSDNILGKGGFGVVYKGDWKHTAVAIKRLKNPGDGGSRVSDESLRELRYLNSCRHDNVLPLYGYSIGGDESCLVYQLMSGGSLEDRLKCKDNRAPLLWKQRLTIAQGVARGLQYLHTVSQTPLIHGDIKSGNILLDTCGEPRIGDFGLAREGPNEFTHMKVSRVHGTMPYLPEEFLKGRILSTKVDAYSFGVVLFELITGLPAYDSRRKSALLRDHVIQYCMKNPSDPSGLQDQRLVDIGECNPPLCNKLVIVGVKCVNTTATKRPSMVDVWQELMSFECGS